MKDQDKTKKQLIDELVPARRRIAELEAAETERKSVERALRESEERFRVALKNSKIAVYNQDRDLRYTWICNLLLGFRAEGILGKTDAELLPPEDAFRLDEIKRQVLESGIGVWEAVRTEINGEAYFYDLTVEPLRDVTGDIVGITGASMDITERARAEEALRKAHDELELRVQERTEELGRTNEALKEEIAERARAEEALRKNERKLRSIIEQSKDGIVLIDEQGAIIEWNHGQEQITGLERDEVLGRPLWDVQFERALEEQRKAPAAYEQLKTKILEFLRTGQAPWLNRLLEQEIQRPDGGRRIIQSLIFPIKTERGFMAGSITRDITERVKAQQEVERGHQRESVLNALLRISMEDTSLEEQLERALDEILSIPWLPVLRQGAIFLAGDDPDVLVLQTQRGLSPALQAVCARVPFGKCLCGQAAASGVLEFADRVDERHEICYEGMVSHGHYCTPILSGDRVIGVIVLYLEEGYQRDVQEEEFLQAVAHTLAGIIERKRAEDALRRSEQKLRQLNEQLEDYSQNLEQKVAARTREIEQRRRVAESLRDVLTILNSNRSLDEILDYIVAEAGRLLGSDTSAIYRLAELDEAFSVQTVQGLCGELVANVDFPPDLCQALREGQPVAVPDVAAASPDDLTPDSRPVVSLGCLTDCYHALLAVPLIVTDEIYGSLVLYYSDPRVFSNEEIGLAVAFGDQVALAIENAWLRQQVKEAGVMEERRRLARELHDSVTQALYSLTLLTEGWRRLAKAGRLEDTEDPLTELGKIAQQALKEMRLMVHELRPPALEKKGLLGALHQRLGAVEKRAGVEARLVAEDVVELQAAVEEELYRISVEALNNALKHGAATSVTVHVRANDEWVELEVADNGGGFDLNTIGESQGMGLDSMRERAEKLGGSVTIHSAPDKGTRVLVNVPNHGTWQEPSSKLGKVSP